MFEIDRKEWLKNRAKGIGGSDASVIMGNNPWKSRLELYEEKVTGNVVEKDNPDLYWGKILEPVIAEEYKKKTGKKLIVFKDQITSKMYPFMNANIDRIIEDENKYNGNGILEIKTKSAFINWENDEIPLYYQIQLQHYLAVTNFKYGSFAVLDMGKKDLIIKDFKRDEELIKKLIEEEAKFWQLVQNKIPPEVEGGKACEQYLKNKYTDEVKGKVISLRDNSNATTWAQQLDYVKREIKLRKEEELYFKNNLMNLIGDAENAVGDGYTIKWKKDKDSIKFDEEKFKEDNPSLYGKYLKPKEGTRRFLLKIELR